MHLSSFGTELRRSMDLHANLFAFLVDLLINQGFVIFNQLEQLIIYSDCIIYSDPLREGNVVISVRVCDVCLPTPRLSPFYLPAYDGQFRACFNQHTYDSMFAFIHLSCMHWARRIILTALYFNSKLNTCYLLHFICHVQNSRAYLSCILHVLHQPS